MKYYYFINTLNIYTDLELKILDLLVI